MKKKVVCLMMATVLLTGCGAKETKEPVKDTPVVESEVVSEVESTEEEIESTEVETEVAELSVDELSAAIENTFASDDKGYSMVCEKDGFRIAVEAMGDVYHIGFVQSDIWSDSEYTYINYNGEWIKGKNTDESEADSDDEIVVDTGLDTEECDNNVKSSIGTLNSVTKIDNNTYEFSAVADDTSSYTGIATLADDGTLEKIEFEVQSDSESIPATLVVLSEQLSIPEELVNATEVEDKEEFGTKLFEVMFGGLLAGMEEETATADAETDESETETEEAETEEAETEEAE